ncbi:hypothetical protein EB796_010366 [Bugula neritina]|uniref:Uncharacterized protein n=1 Tax=Bugula neritina TaxID=10212 RepID=A0A7J7JZG9_BUGNE|nr:hypothetical protein EB796_010366 [Bugula neritina]
MLRLFAHLEEAYTTEHWLVRIYKVLKDGNVTKKSKLNKRLRKKTPSKTSRNKKGTLANQKNVVRGIKKTKSAR